MTRRKSFSSTVREMGEFSPAPTGEYDGTTRATALRELLAKHEPPPQRCEAALLQESAAHAFWNRHRPFVEVDFAETEKRIFRQMAPWHLRMRWFFSRMFKLAVVIIFANIVWGTRAEACTLTAHKGEAPVITDCALHLTPTAAADTLARIAPFIPCPDCEQVFTSHSTPGALSWLAFPAERPARRLDGTLLSDPPTLYGGVTHVPYWTWPASLVADPRARGVQRWRTDTAPMESGRDASGRRILPSINVPPPAGNVRSHRN